MNRRNFIKTGLIFVPTAAKAQGLIVNPYRFGGGTPALATDDFNRADGGLGANWTIQTGSNLAIVSNQAKTTTSGVDQFAFWNAASFAANQYSKMTSIQNAGGLIPSVRASGSGGTWSAYWARADGIHKHVSGVYSNILSQSITVNAGDVLELRITGFQLQRYVNGVATGSAATDGASSLATGSPGFGHFKSGSDVISDTWEGGDL